MMAAALGLASSVVYMVLTGNGVFLAGLRLIIVSIAFIIFSPAAGAAIVISGPLVFMWAMAVIGFYYVIVKFLRLMVLSIILGGLCVVWGWKNIWSA